LYSQDWAVFYWAAIVTQGYLQNDEGQTGQSIHNVVYCSQSVVGMDEMVIDKIIAAAKYHNPRFGITGLLVFGSGIFFQWLEGPRDNVKSLMEIISADSRHSSVVVLSQDDEIRERLFPSWDMELVAAADISIVLQDAMQDATNAKQRRALSLMLKELKKACLDIA
jgi:hypothetical protein